MPNLIVAGTGIKSIAHITEETKRVIKMADKILYLLNENFMKQWIEREAKNAESLEPIYFGFSKRIDAYHQITQKILDEYQKHATLCVLLYGHPTVFAQSALEAVKQIHTEYGNATILPAVSAQDCLYSDLCIDPGDRGCLSIDTTELLLYERILDPLAHVILWQPYFLGGYDIHRTGQLPLLRDYLKNFYDCTDNICIYEAATLPMQHPRKEWVQLSALADVQLTPISTLYFPPASKGMPSKKYCELMKIDINNFQSSC